MTTRRIFDPGYWANRLKGAAVHNHQHLAVYLTEPEDWRAIEKAHAEVIAKVIPKGARVLDAGCGYGRLAPLFDNYTGIDLSPHMVAKAQELNPGKTFLVGDLRNLPYKRRRFDWAVCSSIAHMVVGNAGQAEWEAMQTELLRVAKRVLLLEYTTPSDYGVVSYAKK